MTLKRVAFITCGVLMIYALIGLIVLYEPSIIDPKKLLPLLKGLFLGIYVTNTWFLLYLLTWGQRDS